MGFDRVFQALRERLLIADDLRYPRDGLSGCDRRLGSFMKRFGFALAILPLVLLLSSCGSYEFRIIDGTGRLSPVPAVESLRGINNIVAVPASLTNADRL